MRQLFTPTTPHSADNFAQQAATFISTVILILTISLFLIACENKTGDSTINKDQERGIIQDTFRNDIERPLDSIDIDLTKFKGEWREYLIWRERSDSGWLSIKPIDAYTEYHFMDENKYVRKYFKQGILQSTVNGRFFIEKDARETFLVFTDSILLASKKHGDTLLLQAENVHFINDTMFRIGSRKNASGNSIFQFKRIE